ncbi:MAG TPA: dehydrogenase [Helicobacteraceae bacterium]|nr:dehydrogenase [Helicobacteraceae bacterium]
MEETLSRSNFYALISRILMQEIDSDLLNTIKNDPTILEYLPNLKAWDKLQTLDNNTILQEYFNPDYVNLTILHLIPYETFYTREDQKVETGGANPVTDMYNRYEFVVDYEVARTVAADHIGIEFEFMHYLCDAQLRAEKANDMIAAKEFKEVQKEFLDKHLVQWAPLFLINMKYEARTALYADTADLALEFLLSDNELLSA